MERDDVTRHGHRPVAPTPLTRTADVVIVGAGVLGAATASRLARDGHRVVVLERGAPGREGSGTIAGDLHVQVTRIRRPGETAPPDGARLLPLQRAASALWETVEDDLGASVELRRCGGFTVAETEGQVRELHDKHGREIAAGVETEVLDGDAARSALPLLGPAVAAATWCPSDGYANPLKVTPAYLADAARHGAELVPFTPVERITRTGGTWRVEAGGRTLEAPVVVDAAGPWLGEVAALTGVGLRLTPVTLQMHATVRAPATLRPLVRHAGAGLSVKQAAAGNLLVGGRSAGAVNLAGRSEPAVDGLVGDMALAVRMLPFIRDLRLLRVWAGPLAATPDGMPVIGEVPGMPGFLVAGGTRAFTLAPLWAETLGCLVAGTAPPVDVADLGPDRLVRRNRAG
ncbi:sarcosine oxidase subunit beta [Streptosporangium becharense]|uniref:Sarcosine oxidase subunit beta n=1 Tax=Streptosporangium becharense TaxID=1816182 RepID=A0A7W9MJB5_9ACTN|nr:FAD-binding oxidoreductase [Streptosporangium becharense]MBB2910334.1 sarcosine oxidase subunit beta [Streptosporangium becharense]MBB5823077.1 sarcosine oxidase subunit beta [Streptosporangium becharense]